MAKRYEPEGTKSYLIAALVLAVLAAWHIFDGWVPQARWRGREASAVVELEDFSFVVQASCVGTNLNETVVRFTADAAADAPDEAPVQAAMEDGWVDITFQPGHTTVGDLLAAIDELDPLTAVPPDDWEPNNRVITGPTGLEVTMDRGREGKYPYFPDHWYDFRLHEFYAYNRYTGVLMAIASAVCAYIHRVVK